MLKNEIILKDLLSHVHSLKNVSKDVELHLKKLMTQKFSLAGKIKVDKKKIEKELFSNSYIVFVNGYFDKDLSDTSALKFLKVEKEEASAHNPKSFPFKNPPSEYLISLPDGIIAKEPLQILHVITEENNNFFSAAIKVNIGKNSSLNIFSNSLNLGAKEFLFTISQAILLDEKAKASYTTFFDFNSYCFDHIRADLKKEAVLDVALFTEGGILDNKSSSFDLGENSVLNFIALSLLEEKREAHINVDIDHNAPFSSSYCKMKGIVNDEALSSFQTSVTIKKDAAKAQSEQLCSNFLLSEKAKARARPYLSVLTDDVKASHGATFSSLKDDELFYLRSRGIDERQARTLLIKGICKEIINLVKVESLREILNKKALYNFKVEE